MSISYILLLPLGLLLYLSYYKQYSSIFCFYELFIFIILKFSGIVPGLSFCMLFSSCFHQSIFYFISLRFMMIFHKPRIRRYYGYSSYNTNDDIENENDAIFNDQHIQTWLKNYKRCSWWLENLQESAFFSRFMLLLMRWDSWLIFVACFVNYLICGSDSDSDLFIDFLIAALVLFDFFNIEFRKVRIIGEYTKDSNVMLFFFIFFVHYYVNCVLNISVFLQLSLLLVWFMIVYYCVIRLFIIEK